MSHGSQGLLFNWLKAAVEEGGGFCNFRQFPSQGFTSGVQMGPMIGKGFKPFQGKIEGDGKGKKGDGNCQNDLGEMSNTVIAFCIKS